MVRIAFFLLLPLPLFLPYLWLDHLYFWGNPDSIYYLNLYTSYRDALWHGELFPHWIADVNDGLGSLVFYHRAPLVYTITALLSAPFTLSDEHQYLLGIYASQLFGAVVIYRWLRVHYDTKPAFYGAFLFTFVPYKWIDIYQHFTLGECWAIAFIPLWFHAAERLNTRNGIITYALAAALCFYAHALTVLSVGPLAVAYALHCANWQWRSMLKPLILVHLLVLSLIASYLAAMITANPWLQLDRWSDDKYNPVTNLYHIDDFIGAYALLFAWLIYRSRKKLASLGQSKTITFWCLSLIILYTLATPLSYPLWANISAMNIFQFPFSRLQPAMAVITALLGVYLLGGKRREFSIAVISIYALFTLFSLVHITLAYQRPHNADQLTHDLAIQYRIIPGPIHFPIWATIGQNDLLIEHERYSTMPLMEVKDGRASIDNVKKNDGQLSAHVTVSSQDATMVISQFYIPAWKASADNQPLNVTPYSNGLIQLQLPKGKHHVELAIGKSLLERIGDALTLAALTFIIGVIACQCSGFVLSKQHDQNT